MDNSLDELKFKNIIHKMLVKYKAEFTHAFFVEKTATTLFKYLYPLHKLNKDSLILLKHASLLHDIGYYINSKNHNVHSKYIIENDALLNDYPEESKKILSLVVNNHRKKLHKDTYLLDRESTSIVIILSSLIRIADALAYNGANTYIDNILIENNTVILIVKNLEDFDYSKTRINKKKDIFENFFKKNLNLEN